MNISERIDKYLDEGVVGFPKITITLKAKNSKEAEKKIKDVMKKTHWDYSYNEIESRDMDDDKWQVSFIKFSMDSADFGEKAKAGVEKVIKKLGFSIKT